jgi:outer membrane protein assembly factor BamB
MEKSSRLFVVIALLAITGSLSQSQNIAQWRGANRDGMYEGEHLLKIWPNAGPKLLWFNEGIGDGFGSIAVTSDRLFVNGKIDSLSYTFAFDLNGNLLWKTPNGGEFTGTGYTSNFPGSRSTPLVINDLVYVSSAKGRIACLEIQTGKEKWFVDMAHDFNGIANQHGYCESLMVDGDNVYCLPGGANINVAAINRFSGKLVWASKALGDTVSYCSPMVIKLPARNILVTFSGHYLMGLDTKNGELLWWHKQPYHEFHQQCNTPIYSDGYIYYIAGEGNGAVKLELSIDGKSIKEIWNNKNIKNVFNGFVKINQHLFSPDPTQKIKCLDISTGQVVDSIKINKGGLIYADSMLYCYSDNGNLNLIKLNGTKMELAGKFKVGKGTKEHFAHPVIHNGVLYIRHGKALMAYDVKQQ